jgi:DNA mismatch repair protein MutS2
MHAEAELEFEALRELLGRYVRTPLGRAELAKVAPGSDRESIEAALADTAEAMEHVKARTQPQPASRGAAFSGAAALRIRFEAGEDPMPAVARLRIEGATLEPAEIFELTRLLDLAGETRSVLMQARERFPRLAAHAASIADLRDVTASLRGKILPDGSLTDDASVALGKLRRDQERQRKLIEQSLERFLRAHGEDGTLQEDFVTIRNDRFVVPVVTGRERKVDGVIHGSSGSGATVFVEPLETIHLNNDLVRLHEEELREIHRLLREFTGRLREHAAEIGATAAAMGRLEFLFAKAEFGEQFDCSIPKLSAASNRRLLLRDARHPLLEAILKARGGRVAPLSLILEGDQRTLLISGPNTGGKTVALKTAGLLALMAHAGLPVPATEAEFPLFDQVLADIGDHQSLQESLSSFSAHIGAVRSMLERATPDSLVLLDELGRATDPEEGGALGVALLERFRGLGAFTLASTHLMAMKVYGASTAGVLNGSMGFDEQTLQPTYVLRLGAPGKSAGLDIARRLGLDDSLIGEARERMTTAEQDVSRFLAEMHQRMAAVEQERAAVDARERTVEARERAVEREWERKYSAKMREVERRAAELSAEFEKRARETIGELSQKAQAKVARTRREFQEAVEALKPAVAAGHGGPVGAAAPVKLKLEEGARVKLRGVKQAATIRRLLGDEQVEVDAGFLKMRISTADIEEVLPPTDAPARKSSIGFKQGPDFETSYREINLIGQRAEEACDQVEKFLDNATLAQVERVRIIHGHGMGVLKKAVADLLKHSPHVEKYYVAPPEEGGAGSTIAVLK